MAGRAREDHALAELDIAVDEEDAAFVDPFATRCDVPRPLHRVEVRPCIPFAPRRNQTGVRESVENTPEILRADLAPPALLLRAMGLGGFGDLGVGAAHLDLGLAQGKPI